MFYLLGGCGYNDSGAELFEQIWRAATPLQMCDKKGAVKTVANNGWRLTETTEGSAHTIRLRKTVDLDGKSYQLEAERTRYDIQYKEDGSFTMRGDTHVNRLWHGTQLVIENKKSDCTLYMNFEVGGQELGLVPSNTNGYVMLFERAVQTTLNLPQAPFYRPFPYGFNLL